MIRPLHRWAGLSAALIVSVTALSGAALSLYPAAEALGTQAPPAISVGTLAARVQEAVPGLEQIRQAASGRIVAYAFDNGTAARWVIDAATGSPVAPVETSGLELWLTNLHRALLLGDAGRMVVAAASLAMLALTLSGLALAARRMGGWGRLFGPLRGPLPQRLHLELARFAVAGLALSAVTGLWLAAGSFGFLPDGGLPPYPAVSGTGGLSPAAMTALRDLPLSDLRDLTFPRAGNLRDVFTVETRAGTGYVDQGTGQMLAWSARGWTERATDIVMMLHTGRGLAALGLILGLAALTVPVLSLTGLMQQKGRNGIGAARPTRAVGPEAADTILLVGSEGGTTWGFAEALRRGLTRAGQAVHVAPMADFDPARYARAARILVLAATSGDGDAPHSARGFLDKVNALAKPPAAPLAVLGFGDSAFPAFCGYAEKVRAAAMATGWAELVPMGRVDRQSEQDFARWTRSLAEAMGIDLDLHHRPVAHPASDLTLVSRRDYGAEVQAPTAILRFALPRRGLWDRLTGRGFGRFRAGDLLAVLPQGDTTPRYYSLASGTRDGFVEICVRKHPGGLCSGQLMDLRPGDAIRAFLRPNPAFHPAAEAGPLILIGAGTGIGPLAGFARANRARRPIHLYFGARAPESDLLYGAEFDRWQADGRLTRLATAFSRTDRAYVQDLLRRDADMVRRLVAGGARIMVCGGRGMARGVAEALDEILTPAGLCPVTLKAEGRYVEDVY